MSATLNVQHAPIERLALDSAGWPGLWAWPVDNRFGESPVWDAAEQALLWIDVRAPAVLRLHLPSDTLTRWMLPDVVGALALAGPGQVALALRRSVALLDLGSARLHTIAEVLEEPDGNRLDDGKVSPTGRWWVFGFMDDGAQNKQPSGALYCAAWDGGSPRIRRLHTGPTVANGVAFSPCGTRLWFSDSHAGQVFSAAWNEATGTMGTPAPWCTSGEADGRPDGAAVDAAGHYWSAGVSAGCLNRFGADGRLLQKLPLPCRAPTMPCFGGADQRTLFVTSLQRPHWRAVWTARCSQSRSRYPGSLCRIGRRRAELAVVSPGRRRGRRLAENECRLQGSESRSTGVVDGRLPVPLRRRALACGATLAASLSLAIRRNKCFGILNC